LARQGINAAMIHGDRSQSQRTAALEGFQQGRFRVLVATDVASRGIHVQDIAHVINYDLPEIAENFIHRVGRTGRAGELGVASTLFSRDQRTELFQLERTLGIKMERMPVGAAEPEENDRVRSGIDFMPRASKPKLAPLPGEFLQVEM
jgi:ATP-dependent RNA helicase RhlE